MSEVLKIHPSDNVAVALKDLERGVEVELPGGKLTVRERIPAGHKVALVPIPEGSYAIKYGAPIGRALKDINPGDWVHTHNLRGTRGRGT
ncbi:MAG TPA: hypothetical protein EYP17_01835 [Candidatus Latescibacteria bacterium]|nr:hypothetical protein [Candidatus Latescibacterota bacterium]